MSRSNDDYSDSASVNDCSAGSAVFFEFGFRCSQSRVVLLVHMFRSFILNLAMVVFNFARARASNFDSVSNFLDCLSTHYKFANLDAVHVSNVSHLKTIDTSVLGVQPFIVNGLETAFFKSREKPIRTLIDFMDVLMESGYGEMRVGWQFANTGNSQDKQLHLFEGGCSSKDINNAYCTSFARATEKIRERIREVGAQTCSSLPQKNTVGVDQPNLTDSLNVHPSFMLPPLSHTSACAAEFSSIVNELCLHQSTPLYIMTWLPSSASNKKNKQSRKNEKARTKKPLSRRRVKHRRPRRRGDNKKHASENTKFLPMRMISDGLLPENPPPIPIVTDTSLYHDRLDTGVSARRYQDLNGLDVYFGTPMSGTYMHTHGTAVISSSGRKLWILYSPKQQCKLDSPFGANMLANAKLPPLCDETNPYRQSKHLPNSTPCLGQLHPMEVFRKLSDIEEPARPILVLTKPGETLVLPERWMHMTVNLDDSFTVSYRFERSMPYTFECPTSSEVHQSSEL